MRHLVNERKAILAICFIACGILVLTQVKLFAAPVLVSEKSLGLLLLALVLLTSGCLLIAKAIQRA